MISKPLFVACAMLVSNVVAHCANAGAWGMERELAVNMRSAWINFALFAIPVFIVLMVYLHKTCKERSEEIQQSLRRNHDVYNESLAAFHRAETQLKNIDNYRQELLQETQKEGMRLVEAERKSAIKTSDKFLLEAENRILAERTGVKKKLVAELLDMAVADLARDVSKKPTETPARCGLSAISRMADSARDGADFYWES